MTRPVSYNEIPVLQPESGEEPEGLEVLADGLPARVWVHDRYFASSKVVIEFERPHPKFDDFFTTKYFILEKPGVLEWGYDGGVIRLEHRP